MVSGLSSRHRRGAGERMNIPGNWKRYSSGNLTGKATRNTTFQKPLAQARLHHKHGLSMAKTFTAPASLVWLRQDLRLQDQPAFAAALAAGGPIIPVFIWSPEEQAPWSPGGASRWWLHHALADLDYQLRSSSSRLILRTGPSVKTLLSVAKETNARRVFWSRSYEPAIRQRDGKVAAALRAAGLDYAEFPGALLFEPETIANQSGKPFQVFTTFWRHCLTQPRPHPQKIDLGEFATRTPASWPTSQSLESLSLLPQIRWDKEFYQAWDPTLEGVRLRAKSFVKNSLPRYSAERDWPAQDSTSRFSPYLHFGQISPRQAWAVVDKAATGGTQKFLAEIGWREFAHHLLFHFPQLPEQPLREEFLRFPWEPDAEKLRAWQQGQTGYPLVDAGMRQLWQTGWMHNRVRMVAASFLVKHLRQPWTDGEKWFWDTLVDADLASNSMGWQWVAGCGADAAPYFRVFNPVLQGERFDPEGDYVRQYVPELAKLPAQFIHAPWRAPNDALHAAGVELGKNYPRPIVDHDTARRAALQAYEMMRKPL